MQGNSVRGRPALGDRPLTAAERKSRSRSARALVPLTIDVPVEVHKDFRALADAENKSQAEFLRLLLEQYIAKAARL